MQLIRVTIVFDSKGERCEAVCGLNWSSDETFATMKQRVKDRFGGIAKLELVDLAKGDPRTAELKERIGKENLSLPLLLINNELRISGEFDARQLMDAVEVERELKWKTNMT